jgi:hypothetical protein
MRNVLIGIAIIAVAVLFTRAIAGGFSDVVSRAGESPDQQVIDALANALDPASGPVFCEAIDERYIAKRWGDRRECRTRPEVEEFFYADGEPGEIEIRRLRVAGPQASARVYEDGELVARARLHLEDREWRVEWGAFARRALAGEAH